MVKMPFVNILSILSDSFLRRSKKPIKENSSSPSGTVLKTPVPVLKYPPNSKEHLETF